MWVFKLAKMAKKVEEGSAFLKAQKIHGYLILFLPWNNFFSQTKFIKQIH